MKRPSIGPQRLVASTAAWVMQTRLGRVASYGSTSSALARRDLTIRLASNAECPRGRKVLTIGRRRRGHMSESQVLGDDLVASARFAFDRGQYNQMSMSTSFPRCPLDDPKNESTLGTDGIGNWGPIL
jgi:hypothetical protein